MDELKQAFTAVYQGLCDAGLVEDNPQILEALWQEFQEDMANGFSSLFEKGKH